VPRQVTRNDSADRQGYVSVWSWFGRETCGSFGQSIHKTSFRVSQNLSSISTSKTNYWFSLTCSDFAHWRVNVNTLASVHVWKLFKSVQKKMQQLLPTSWLSICDPAFPHPRCSISSRQSSTKWQINLYLQQMVFFTQPS